MIAILLYTCYFFCFCSSSAVIEIRLVSFNSSGLLASKSCCDTTTKPCPPDGCDPVFFVCLQDFSGYGCPLGNVTTGYTPNSNAIIFSDVIGDTGTRNPLLLNVVNYPGVVIAKVTVYDDDRHEGGTGDPQKMDYMQYIYRFAPDKNGTHRSVNAITLSGSTSSLAIEIDVYCDTNYFGNKCDVSCVPDSLWYCDMNGHKVCRSGKDCTGTTQLPSPTTSLRTATSTPTPTSFTVQVTNSLHSSTLQKTTSAPTTMLLTTIADLDTRTPTRKITTGSSKHTDKVHAGATTNGTKTTVKVPYSTKESRSPTTGVPVYGYGWNTSTMPLMLQTLCCHGNITAQPITTGKGSNSDTVTIIVPAVIVGLIALLSILIIYFICKRKCKRRQIAAEKTTDLQAMAPATESSFPDNTQVW